MSDDNIKVAVRLRGFNPREKELKCVRVVNMNSNQTVVKSETAGKEHMFAFDYSYWSFDGYKEEADGFLSQDSTHPNGSKYCDQKKVFDDLGRGILSNAWDGFNASLFAYGQTGSGKSYSMFGTPSNKGIVPQFCEALFAEIKEKKASSDHQFEVTFSMIEIYNEIVRDLLNAKKAADKKGLPIHERPGRGFHIMEKDLKPTPFSSYEDFERLYNLGNKNRTIAATQMNNTSSRAHTIVEICFKQTFKNETGQEMQRESIIDLIDLAGSERVEKTGAMGDRLKEGAAINLSLTTLGNCIAALVEKSRGKNIQVPFRNSSLTKLLMNALGGNSKTIMIAAISPADDNFDETVSTLRYADRAKQIKCKAVVNEDPKDKLIRELQDEINKLKANIKSGGVIENIEGLSKGELDRLKKEMEENMKKQIEESEREMREMKKSYEEKLAEAKKAATEISKDDLQRINQQATITPHFSNINVDPMLTGSLKHLIEVTAKKPKLTLGSSDKVDIILYGLGVQDRHACISQEDGKLYMEPYTNSRVIRNGKLMDAKFKMENLDRYVFGASLYYIFVNPHEFNINGEADTTVMQNIVNEITYDKVQKEIAEESGLITEADLKRGNREEIACLNELIDLIPHIEEANQMSILLDKKVKYRAVIMNPLVIGETEGKVTPMIVVKKFGTSVEYIWDKYKFIDRKSLMSEMYLDLKVDGKIDKEKFKEMDPFLDAENEHSLIGVALVEPKCVLHMIKLEENTKIFDYHSKISGSLSIQIEPTDKQGNSFKNLAEVIVHNPEKQLKQLNLMIRINNVRCLSPKFKKIFVQYKLFGDEIYTRSEAGDDTNNPNINHQKFVSFEKVDINLIKHFMTKPFFVQVYGIQKVIANDSNKMSTKDWFKSEEKSKINSVDSMKEEIAQLKTELDKYKHTFKNLEMLLDFAEKKKSKNRIKIDYVRECLLSNQPDVLNRMFSEISKSEDK